MKHALLILAVIVLSACHTTARVLSPTVSTERAQTDDSGVPSASIEVPNLNPPPPQNETPPCVAAPAAFKPVSKRRSTAAVAKVAGAPEVAAPLEPAVKPIASISLSVLGKKVRAANGEDLGRLVDILADAQGRVRAAIIESGGFLGVGNRRVAVDWALLKFRSDRDDPYVVLVASAQALQETPEYKESHQPVALMAPNDSAATATKP